MLATYPDVEDLVVMGASAGARTRHPLFAAMAADELPDANVTTFGDSAGAYPDVPSVNASIGGGMWGTDTVGPDWPGYAELTPEQRSIPGLYVQAMQHNPDITYARFDFAFDEVQSFFGSIAGFAADQLVTLIDQTAAQAETVRVCRSRRTSRRARRTRSSAGDEFYDMEVEGVRLVDWFAAVLAGEAPPDVHCVECRTADAHVTGRPVPQTPSAAAAASADSSFVGRVDASARSWANTAGGSRHGSGSVPFRAASMVRQTRSEVHGRSMCRTPRCASASITAFCTAGVEPIVAASPMPFAPSGLSGVGVSVECTSNDGSSAADGMAYSARFDVIGLPSLS